MPQVVKMLQYDTTDTNKGKSKPVPHGTVQRPTKTELDMDITSSSSETTPIPRTPHDPGMLTQYLPSHNGIVHYAQ